MDDKIKKEGTSPTDIDSAGKDQDLDNIGSPFDNESMQKVINKNIERDKLEREYQKKLLDLMGKTKMLDDGDNNKKNEPDQKSSSDKRKELDSKIKDYLIKMKKENDKQKKEEDAERNNIPVRTTSTYFVDDKKRLFSPRTDINPEKGNADKSGSVIDEE